MTKTTSCFQSVIKNTFGEGRYSPQRQRMSFWRRKRGLFRGRPNPWDVWKKKRKENSTLEIRGLPVPNVLRGPVKRVVGNPLLFRSDQESHPVASYPEIDQGKVRLLLDTFNAPALAHWAAGLDLISLPEGFKPVVYHPPPPPPIPKPGQVPSPCPPWSPVTGDWTNWVKSIIPYRKRIAFLEKEDPLGQECDRLSCYVLKAFLLASLSHFHRVYDLPFDAQALFADWTKYNRESVFAPLLKKWLAVPCALSIDLDRRVQPGVGEKDWLILISPNSRDRALERVMDRDCPFSFAFQRIKGALPPLGPILRKESIDSHGKILSDTTKAGLLFTEWCSQVASSLFPTGWMSGKEILAPNRVTTRSSALFQGRRVPRSMGGGQSVLLHEEREEEVVDGRWEKKEGKWSFVESWRGQATVQVSPIHWRAFDEPMRTVEVVQVSDPLKARTVTICNVASNVLRPLQKKIHSHLRSLPVFRFIGKTVEARDLKVLGRAPLLNSADYSAATDGIFSNLSLGIISAILDKVDWDGVSASDQKMVRDWSEGSLVRNRVQLPGAPPYEQNRGQLMGSLLSFPVLCLVNFSCWSFSQFRSDRLPARNVYHRGRRYPVDARGIPVSQDSFLSFISSPALLSHLPVRINGDDLVSGETKSTMEDFQQTVPLMGCSLSVGKSFVSKQWLTINSMLWHRQADFFTRSLVPNWSALYRGGFLDGRIKRVEWEEQEGGWSSLLQEWLRSFPSLDGKLRTSGLRWRLFKEALKLVNHITYGPECIGHSGIFPQRFQLSISDRVRLFKPSILMECPPKQARVALELLSSFAPPHLPPLGVELIDPRNPPPGWTPEKIALWEKRLRWARGLAGQLMLRLPEAPDEPDPIVFVGSLPDSSIARNIRQCLIFPIGSGVRRLLPKDIYKPPQEIDLDLPVVEVKTDLRSDNSIRSWWKTRAVECATIRVVGSSLVSYPIDSSFFRQHISRGELLTQFGSRELSPLDNEEWLFVSLDPEVCERAIKEIIPAPHPMRTREKFRNLFKKGGERYYFEWRSCSLNDFLFLNFRIQSWLAGHWKFVLERGTSARS